MVFTGLKTYGTFIQYIISFSLVISTAIICYFSVDIIGYRVVALVLLLVVSVLAMLYDILPVLFMAVLSALIWNFFFIPPIYNFYIGNTEDALMFGMYFVIALINAVLTFKIRELEKKARDKDERERTIKLYNTFLNSLSHELRTPLATIIGSIDTIRDHKDRITPDNREDLHEEIEKAAVRLNRQVENLLSMSKLEANVLELRKDWCDINELIYTVISNNKEEAGQHKIRFEADPGLPLFKLDRFMTGQIIHNIILNAMQHTPEQTVITVSARQYDDGCRIIISDNGPGFPQEEMHSVFTKFYRLPKSKAGGTGLGLSIAKGFTEAQDGRIRLENNKAGGARFNIDIPANTSHIDKEQ